ncbi:alpha/beta fold hydrolase [Sinosporangium album]|uniref:alpha/beta fold hydrolase n=1 Tax=Sinosporangium album TaxID=504805 RepID=UPI00115FC52C|nr:alpha/beta hydrolase [Sinosporangium album]
MPTLLWHGEQDVFSPVEHSRWLADRIPTATMRVEEGAAHFRALNVMPDMLPWLAGRAA